MDSENNMENVTNTNDTSWMDEGSVNREDTLPNVIAKKEMPKEGNYGLWRRPKILMDLIRRYSNGLIGANLIHYLNKTYNTDYDPVSYVNIISHPVWKEELHNYETRLKNQVTGAILARESKDVAEVIINSKDVLRAAINKMGSLLGKIDETDELNSELVRNIKTKYGDYSRVMKELRETIKLLNELEGTGESITIEDIMSKFKRNKEGEIIDEKNENK